MLTSVLNAWSCFYPPVCHGPVPLGVFCLPRRLGVGLAFVSFCFALSLLVFGWFVNTPSNTGTHMRGDNARQGETKLGEGGQHRHICGRQGETNLGKADTRSNTGTHVGTMGDNGRQGESHMCGDTGRHGETRVDKSLGRRTHHPTQAHMWGQWETMGDTETMGDKGRHWIFVLWVLVFLDVVWPIRNLML